MRIYHLYVCIVLTLGCIFQQAHAVEIVIPDKELQELLKLDVEQLTTVSVASKHEEQLNEAPGIITISYSG